MNIQQQTWKEYTRYLISDEYGSVMINLYNEPQKCGSKSYTAWIWGLYVYPEHRRKGHAKRLLEEVERIALENGHKDVCMAWDAEETRKDILDFYIHKGYNPVCGEVSLYKELASKINKVDRL